jgi:hypothetical protein
MFISHVCLSRDWLIFLETINLPLSSNASLYMGSFITAHSTAIPWNLVQQPFLSSDTLGTTTTMALAQNHAPQSMGNFPTSHGKTASFFLDEGVQQEYMFTPDGSAMS